MADADTAGDADVDVTGEEALDGLLSLIRPPSCSPSPLWGEGVGGWAMGGQLAETATIACWTVTLPAIAASRSSTAMSTALVAARRVVLPALDPLDNGSRLVLRAWGGVCAAPGPVGGDGS